jgi:hypothetical protein
VRSLAVVAAAGARFLGTGHCRRPAIRLAQELISTACQPLVIVMDPLLAKTVVNDLMLGQI